MSSTNCTEFRAHPLRPDKCRSCFADLSRHQSQLRPASESIAPKCDEPATSENEAQNAAPKATSANASKSQFANMSREQLIEELQRLRDEAINSSTPADKDNKSERVMELSQDNKSLVESERTRQGESSEDCGRCNRLSADLEEARREWKSAQSERDRLMEELKTLEREMEEMHDNFKEEESEQFEQVKQELDLAVKNCKILQIRLGKSERQYGQLEQVKSLLERQLSEEQLQSGSRPALNCTCRFSQKSADGNQPGGLLATFGQSSSEPVRLSSGEYDQLLRDLNDTIERERDLQEQIKYSQEEAQLKSDRLQAMEAENELLASKVTRLTSANARLRSGAIADTQQGDSLESACKLIEQNEQLKLALELAQSESQRLRNKMQEVSSQLEAREGSLKESELNNCKLEEELLRLKCLIEQSRCQTAEASEKGQAQVGQSGQLAEQQQQHQVAKLEAECRQLRARLVHSERAAKQLKAQLEMAAGSESATGDFSPSEQAKTREINRQLRQQCESLKAQNSDLERRIERMSLEQGVGSSLMESDLLDKLKRQLETSESELAKSRSRLVELDLECGRAQRQYKRLVSSLEGGQLNETARRAKLPSEPLRDALSRQELRQLIKELEEELDESLVSLRSKDCLISELRLVNAEQRSKQASLAGESSRPMEQAEQASNAKSNSEEQVKSLRRLLEQERLLSNNLKLDVRNLEESRTELMSNNRMLERKQVSMDEEINKLRELNAELRLNIDEAKQAQRANSNRLLELQLNVDKLRQELAAKQTAQRERELSSASNSSSRGDNSPKADQSSGDLLLMARDLSELKVKNGFLMRQIEIAQEDSGRQLEDLRVACEAQQRRAVEMAQLEVKERHLTETQQLKEELNELRQKLVASQRQVARNDELVSSERDRLRSFEREWKRDKSQWQQRVEQLEAQLTLERRSNEFKTRETEAQVREKDRELIGIQDRYVQMERDLKRLQNKHNLLEENSESKQKNLERELEAKKRELGDLVASKEAREEEFYENCKRFNGEKATLLEALESIRSSFDEKQVELKRIRELLVLRQDQAYKERMGAQERIDALGRELVRLADQETQVKVMRQQVEANERQLEALKRDCMQLKEEKSKLRQRCDELERKCSQYEKQELITKTSNISNSSSFLKSRLSFGNTSSASNPSGRLKPAGGSLAPGESLSASQTAGEKNQCETIERLSSKINDQRHLINMLKQQYDETQMEAKQLKLIQAAEKSKWQSRVAQLNGQLNECEERLLFETSAVIGAELFDAARRKSEAKWALERRNTLDTLQQVQAQCDQLVRDMKKLGQSHDLLRLHCKQLEGHNKKLSRKLIEYQQQLASSGSSSQGRENKSLGDSADSERKLATCLEDRQTLLDREARLIRQNGHLASVLRVQVQPLLETVAKMVAALDGSGSSDSTGAKTQVSSASQSSLADESARSNSTKRPLVAPSPTSARQPDLISSAFPAHQVAAASQSQSASRLSRFLGVKSADKLKPAQTTSSPKDGEPAEPAKAAAPKTVKRVKIKSAALGISAGEKKELRKRVELLAQVLDELADDKDAPMQIAPLDTAPTPKPAQLQSAKSVSPNLAAGKSGQPRASSADRDLSSAATTSSAGSRTRRAGSYAPHSNYAESRVHWRDGSTGAHNADCSDLDSERSWSTSQLEQVALAGGTRADSYRRFPQSSPASYLLGASLTDCESDSSLASDLSSSYSPARGHLLGGPTRRYLTSGAESDGCVGSVTASASSGNTKSAGRKRTGLKTRLTSTLRNISRSISGLASDSEADSAKHTAWLATGRRKQRVDALGGQEAADGCEGDSANRSLREIRV